MACAPAMIPGMQSTCAVCVQVAPAGHVKGMSSASCLSLNKSSSREACQPTQEPATHKAELTPPGVAEGHTIYHSAQPSDSMRSMSSESPCSAS